MELDRAQRVSMIERRSAEHGRLMAEVANSVVRIHKRFYGKGPTKARAQLSHDLLTVLLFGGYTRGEQTLNDRGFTSEVLRSRLAMQSAVEAEFRLAVESLLGRRVLSFMSANDPDNQLQIEVFVLQPLPGHEGAHSAVLETEDLFTAAEDAEYSAAPGSLDDAGEEQPAAAGELEETRSRRAPFPARSA